MASVTLVTFDLDNTLWDVDRVVRRAEERMRTWIRERVPVFDERFPPEMMAGLRTSVLAAEPALRHDLSKFRERLLFVALCQCDLAEAVAADLAAGAFAEFYAARHDVEYFPDALSTLAVLSQRVALAALTNGNADFKRLGLDRYFAFGFNAATVGASKPAPDMFEAALRRAGAAPARAVHVGDHLVDDVQGAAAVGMHTIWVNFSGDSPASGTTAPSREVRRLADIPSAVEAINAALRESR